MFFSCVVVVLKVFHWGASAPLWQVILRCGKQSRGRAKLADANATRLFCVDYGNEKYSEAGPLRGWWKDSQQRV
jgi:hypothetical protein